MGKRYTSEYYNTKPKIYYLSFDDIPFYIGCTKMSLIKRLTDSRNDARTNTSKKDKFIVEQMYRYNKTMDINLIETVDDAKFCLLFEEYWINQFRQWGFILYNTNLIKPPKKIDKRGLTRYKNALIKV